MAQTISATFADRQSAERAAAELEEIGVTPGQLELRSQEHPGATDVGARLDPNRRSITGALVGSLVLGTVGWILGWLITVLISSAQSTTGAAIVASIGGGIVGWLIGAILVSRAPVEESYFREQRIEQGVTRLTVAPADRDAEVRGILTRNDGSIESPVGGAYERKLRSNADVPSDFSGHATS